MCHLTAKHLCCTAAAELSTGVPGFTPAVFCVVLSAEWAAEGTSSSTLKQALPAMNGALLNGAAKLCHHIISRAM